MRNLDPRRARWIRMRMGILCGVMAIGLGGIVSSAYRVQVEDGPEWREMAEKQRQRRLHIEPKRGSDLRSQRRAARRERRGAERQRATSSRCCAASRGAPRRRRQFATPPRDSRRSSRSTRPTSTPSSSTRRRFVWLKRRISGDEAEAVRDLGDPKRQAHPLHGLAIEGEGHRFYPDASSPVRCSASSRRTAQGKDGLELALDDELRGTVEEVRGLRDRCGRLLFEGGGERGASRPRRARRHAHDRRGHPARRRARARRGDAHVRDEGRRRSSSSIRDRARSSRWRACPGTTRTTTARARSTAGAIAR